MKDNLAGVNVEINAVLIMQTLFGFELGNYYRSVFSPFSRLTPELAPFCTPPLS
jgi:hypothetical protein